MLELLALPQPRNYEILFVRVEVEDYRYLERTNPISIVYI